MIVLKICFLLILLIMFVQDIKYRGISWYLFPGLAILLIVFNTFLSTEEVIINSIFILIVLSMLTLWFSVKKGKYVNVLHNHLGTGDILFLICISLYFSPVNFFFFYLITLLIISLITGLHLLWSRPKILTIPLCGLQGMMLLILLSSSWYLDIEPSHHRFFEDYLFNHL